MIKEENKWAKRFLLEIAYEMPHMVCHQAYPTWRKVIILDEHHLDMNVQSSAHFVVSVKVNWDSERSCWRKKYRSAKKYAYSDEGKYGVKKSHKVFCKRPQTKINTEGTCFPKLNGVGICSVKGKFTRPKLQRKILTKLHEGCLHRYNLQVPWQMRNNHDFDIISVHSWILWRYIADEVIL